MRANKPIHVAACLLGISSSTLRRWEAEGLIKFAVERDATGRRVFTDEQIHTLRELVRERHPAKRDKSGAV